MDINDIKKMRDLLKVVEEKSLEVAINSNPLESNVDTKKLLLFAGASKLCNLADSIIENPNFDVDIDAINEEYKKIEQKNKPFILYNKF
ncbi:MAG: hypothetical protein ACLSXI_03325 [Sarcina ventriculi]